MRYFFHALYLIIVVLCYVSCIKVKHPYTGVAPGIWRATLQLDPDQQMISRMKKEYRYDERFDFDEKADGELPFLFEVRYVTADSFIIEIINGKERIPVTDIDFGRDISIARDTIEMKFPIWDTRIKAQAEESVMEGHWIVDYRTDDYKIPFVAEYGKNYRFTTLKKSPVMNISGTWETTFVEDSSNSYRGVGEFEQRENKLTGTFRTETGDYRYLAGTIQEDKIYLSTFDGTHAFLFEGKIFPDSSIHGMFYSGKHYIASWSAHKSDAEAMSLSDPDLLTSPAEMRTPIDFEFINTNGTPVKLSEMYKNTPVVLQIMGTWCPNCLDETRFLVDYLEKNPTSEVKVLGLAFERYADTAKSLKAINRYVEKLDVPYEILLAGTSTSKDVASKALPFIDTLRSFPTTVFLNDQHEIVKIHTGFNGPATTLYEEFLRDFDQIFKSLEN